MLGTDMSLLKIYIDADACPVREEAYKVGLRHDVPISVVANNYLRIMRHPLITMHVVDDSFDAADDYIAERADSASVVITADILLAQRCLEAGSLAIAPNGKLWDNDNIGAAIATRAIMADLRAGADMPNLGGPAPFTHADRSRFLQNLHQAVVRLLRP